MTQSLNTLNNDQLLNSGNKIKAQKLMVVWEKKRRKLDERWIVKKTKENKTKCKIILHNIYIDRNGLRHCTSLGYDTFGLLAKRMSWDLQQYTQALSWCLPSFSKPPMPLHENIDSFGLVTCYNYTVFWSWRRELSCIILAYWSCRFNSLADSMLYCVLRFSELRNLSFASWMAFILRIKS